MKNNPQMYGQQYDPNVLRDLKAINEKMEKAETQEEILQLKMQDQMTLAKSLAI